MCVIVKTLVEFVEAIGRVADMKDLTYSLECPGEDNKAEADSAEQDSGADSDAMDGDGDGEANDQDGSEADASESA